MENQHKLIKGYRDLSQKEIDLMNEGKELSAKVGEWIEKIETQSNLALASNLYSDQIDNRWLAIGKTDLQKGFMGAIRSIAKPSTF